MYHCFQQKLTIFPCSRFRTRGLTGQLASLSSRHGRASLRVFLAGGRPCAALSLPPDPQTRVCLSTPLNDGRWHLLRVYRYFDRFFLVLIKYLFILNCRHVSSLFISVKQFLITTLLCENIINFEILVQSVKIMPVESYSN